MDIAEPILAEAKQVAEAECHALRVLIEEGLQVVSERRRSRRPVSLPDASSGCRGLQPGVREGDWAAEALCQAPLRSGLGRQHLGAPGLPAPIGAATAPHLP